MIIQQNNQKLRFSFATQRLKLLCTPAKDLPSATSKKASNYEAFQTFTDLHTLRKTKSPDDRDEQIQGSYII